MFQNNWYRLTVVINRKSFIRQNSTALSKFTAVLNQDVENALETKELKHRHHPGRRIISCVELPERLINAADTVITNKFGNSTKQIRDESQILSDFLWQRHLPLESEDLKTRTRHFQLDAKMEDGKDTDALPYEESMKIELKRKNKVLKRLHSICGHWKPVNYDEHRALQYLVGRLSADYAALQQVFSELQNYEPNFSPKSLLDFGSGVGSTVWAAHSFWKDSLNEYFCVDTSSDMNSLSRILLQDGKEDSEPMVKQLFFRQYLPAAHLIKYDLVVSAFTLMELPSLKDRLQTVESLWQKTQDVLVLIELGTYAGFTALVQARDYILNVFDSGSTVQYSEDAHVIAPCPHDKSCPRFGDHTKTPCNFDVSYLDLPFVKRHARKSRFSYVILKKKNKCTSQSSPSWPRIVRPVLPRPRHVVCRLCCPDGQLKEIIFTRAKHGKNAYRCARVSNWGDLLPIDVVAKSEETKEETSEADEAPLFHTNDEPCK